MARKAAELVPERDSRESLLNLSLWLLPCIQSVDGELRHIRRLCHLWARAAASHCYGMPHSNHAEATIANGSVPTKAGIGGRHSRRVFLRTAHDCSVPLANRAR